MTGIFLLFFISVAAGPVTFMRANESISWSNYWSGDNEANSPISNTTAIPYQIVDYYSETDTAVLRFNYNGLCSTVCVLYDCIQGFIKWQNTFKYSMRADDRTPFPIAINFATVLNSI